MTIYNLGSINIDHFYSVPHLPSPGETLAATEFTTGLGGKGANQSVAACQAGSNVVHIGAIGQDGTWIIDHLQSFGVEVDHIKVLDMPTAHAIINVDQAGENAIVIFSSANQNQDQTEVKAAFEKSTPSDYCILQNETNLVAKTARLAKENGLHVVYSAAPFDKDAVLEVMPYIGTLVVNEIEARQLSQALNIPLEALPIENVLITRGSEGARYQSKGTSIEMPAFRVDPVDTTGAGDTYLGFFIAGLDQGKSPRNAMQFAAAGAAIQVTRHGTADAIPDLVEVNEFLKQRSGD